MLPGVGGFGSSSAYHTEKIMRLSQDLPIVIEVIENAERIEKMLPELDQIIGDGLVTLEKLRADSVSIEQIIRIDEMAGRRLA